MKVALSKLPISGWWSKGMPKYHDNPAMIESAIPDLELANKERQNLISAITKSGHEIIEFDFPKDSIVIDPWRYIKDVDGVEVIRVGDNNENN